jgi:hypothetical protein
MPPVDWSEHRQPNMVLLPWRKYLWLLFIEVAVTIVVTAAFGSPRTSFASALVISLAIGSLPAGYSAYALRRREPPFRFGIPATVLIATVIWGVFSFVVFVQTYQAY